MQDYHRPRTIRKLCQRILQPLTKLTTFRWIPESSRHRFGKLFRVSNLATPGQVERRISDDSIQPGSEGLRGIEPIQRLIRPQKAFLHCVLGIFVGQDDRPRDYVRAPLVQAHEARETPLIPLLGETYELPFLVRNTYGCGQLLTG